MYYDCHTYNIHTNDNNHSCIVNQTENGLWQTDTFYSVGIHPWDIQEKNMVAIQWQQVEKWASLPSVIAIGECGIDTLKGGSLPLQEYVFQQHISLANTLKKPLIVHSVHGVITTCEILNNASVPVIIHGVNNKVSKIKQFLLNGYYLSFGKNLLNPNGVSKQTITKIPIDRLLLETDDCPYSINEIYQTAAYCLSMSVESLILQIQDNFHRIFNL